MVVIVDAYSSANALAPLFRAAGHASVHVQSAPTIPQIYAPSFVPDGFAANVVHHGDLDATVAALAEHRPVAVLAGIESGVELADALSEALGLLSNGSAGSLARRNKRRMVETVAAAGLRAPRQLHTRDPAAAAAWSEHIGSRVVVKPVSSICNDRVQFCDGPGEVASAVRSIIGGENVLNQHDDAVLVQEYVTGTEYIVNTVGRHGRHHVCEIWQTSHISANGVRDLIDGVHLLPRRGAVQDQLVAYTVEVLRALGIDNGAAHTELKMTPDGPCLIETSARTCGGGLPALARLGIGESQLDWIVDAYVRPDRFQARVGRDYSIDQFVAAVGLLSGRSGVLVGYPRLDDVRALDSFHELTINVVPGQRIAKTVNDFTYPMRVSLRHEVEEIVLHDSRTVRHLDGADFYELA